MINMVSMSPEQTAWIVAETGYPPLKSGSSWLLANGARVTNYDLMANKPPQFPATEVLRKLAVRDFHQKRAEHLREHAKRWRGAAENVAASFQTGPSVRYAGCSWNEADFGCPQPGTPAECYAHLKRLTDQHQAEADAIKREIDAGVAAMV